MAFLPYTDTQWAIPVGVIEVCLYMVWVFGGMSLCWEINADKIKSKIS